MSKVGGGWGLTYRNSQIQSIVHCHTLLILPNLIKQFLHDSNCLVPYELVVFLHFQTLLSL